jgi:hypothetical protein
MRRRMAAGLGLSDDEWAGLRAQVDDSFWVMRVIGLPPASLRPPLAAHPHVRRLPAAAGRLRRILLRRAQVRRAPPCAALRR